MNLAFSRKALSEVCQHYHVRQLALFGSVLRTDFHPDSDVDVLVEFEPGHTPDFFRLYDLEQALSVVFGGHPVESVTCRALNDRVRETVLASAQVVYEAS